MSEHETQMIEAIGADATGLRATMEWTGDRFCHYIDWVAGDKTFRLLDSVEGDDKTEWPPSPAVQQLSVERRTQMRSVGLLVGMAGSSHWSISVENDPPQRLLIFDVACRVAGDPGPLGSQYKSRVPIKIIDPIEKIAECSVAGRKCYIQIESTGRGEVDQLDVKGLDVNITPTEDPESWPATVRWKYRIRG